jgi:MFS family permease
VVPPVARPGVDGARSERLFTLPFALILASGTAYFIALAMLNPVIPLYVRGPLRGGGVAVGVGVGAFALGAVLLRPYAGRVGDRHGRRVLLIGGAAIVAAATACYGLVPSLAWLCVVRVAAGIGEAAFFVGAATMVTDLAPEARRGEAVSYWSIAVYGGLAFGPLIGELVLGSTGNENYTRAWLVSSGFAFLAMLIALATHESADRPAPPEHPGPLLHRSALGPGLVMFCGLVSLAGWSAFVKLYARDDLGMAAVGGVFLLYGVLILCVRMFGARLPDRLGPRTAGSAALLFAVAGMLTIAAWQTPAGLYAGTFVFAIGMSLLYPALLVLALAGVAANERGSVIGTVSSFFDLSQGLGVLICGIAQYAFGYRGMFLTCALLAVVGLVYLRTGAAAAS